VSSIAPVVICIHTFQKLIIQLVHSEENIPPLTQCSRYLNCIKSAIICIPGYIFSAQFISQLHYFPVHPISCQASLTSVFPYSSVHHFFLICFNCSIYVKTCPYTGLDSPWGYQEVEAPRFQDCQHMKVVRLSALRTGRLYPPGNIPGTRFC
jgi:hypothetical protein